MDMETTLAIHSCHNALHDDHSFIRRRRTPDREQIYGMSKNEYRCGSRHRGSSMSDDEESLIRASLWTAPGSRKASSEVARQPCRADLIKKVDMRASALASALIPDSLRQRID
jgi:hypothetical protein